MPVSALRRLSLSLALCAAVPFACAETWPIPDWSNAPAPRNAALDALEAYAFAERDDVTRKGIRTDALLVIRDGQIIYERYAGPTTRDTPHLTWSVSKSLLAATLGAAYGAGRFKLDDAAAQYYPALAAHPQLKVGHLLNWASGLAWQEGYEYAPLTSSVVAMLYTRGRGDMAEFAADIAQEVAPGTRFRYSSGDSNLLSAALRGMVGEQAYKNYPWTALFEPLGITSAVWESDAQGTYVASSYAYMTARDLARIGLLMERDGRWEQRQLLPSAWIAFNRTPFANFQADPRKPGEAVPGGQWWLNVPINGAAKPWNDVPEDAFAALGHWGQALYVIPSEDLIVVRYGDDRDGSYSHNQLLRRVQAAFVPETAQ
ncbi:beta-lactamase family protein [Pseudomonas sp. LS44]|uniref:serine hydrolase domain-containing protein n=1 Tax=Pseudomonas sp. LS44 TaxID=1357074 RepID=UPI00215A7344|nr:serine hydrolase [Pseudomonas sp. LS44]UVE18668.1 beta-lactamase family protein [Pseudomonas sp. LS44]